MSDPHKTPRPDGQTPEGEATSEPMPDHEPRTPREEHTKETQSPGAPRALERDPAAASAAIPSAKAPTGGRPAGAKTPVLQSFSDLLRAAYGTRSKRLNPKKAEIVAMRSAPRPDPAEREELLALAASDRTLRRTRELMLLSIEWIDSSVLSGQVREFVREALRRHPAFIRESLAAALENRPDGPSEEAAVRDLSSRPYASLPWPEGMAALNQKEAAQCRVNALCCLLLWLRETRGIAFEHIQRHLLTSIWRPSARNYKTAAQQLRALMSTKDPAGMAIACSVLEREAVDQGRQAAAARTAEERVAGRARELEEQIDKITVQLEAAKVQAARLAEEVARARHTHEDEKAHMRNDYEGLRGTVLRRLREEVLLLDEGLHALRRVPPKVHVMIDHAERAIDGLKREMGRLEGKD
jgi:hypothetical protein